MNRRHFLQTLTGALAAPLLVRSAEPLRLRYVLASALYGEMPLETILPEIAKTGAESMDIWCKKHGNQREQAAALGDEAFAALLKKHAVRLGVSTQYPAGPFALQEEMAWVKRHGGTTIVTGAKGPKDLEGAAAKTAVREFLEAMKPHTVKAEELGITLAIENHAGSLLSHPDSLRAFAELNRSPRLGIALAFHHLHPWHEQIPALIRDLGAAQLPFIYFQEDGDGSRKTVPKEIELQQLPGHGGPLDYRPILKAMRDIRFTGLVEIFMHPTPRGVAILPTAEAVTAEVNRSRAYIEQCLREIGA